MIYYNGRHWKESRVKREREREREQNIPCTVVQGLWSNFGATLKIQKKSKIDQNLLKVSM